MRCVLAMLMAVVVARADAAPLPASEITSSDAALAWISAYRPRAFATAPAAVRAMSRYGLLRKPDSAGVYVGFIAGVFRSRPDRADALVARMFPLPAEDHWVVVRAIAWSGLPGWKDLLRRNAARMPTRAVMIEKYLGGALPTLDQLDLADHSVSWFARLRGDVGKVFGAKPPAKAVRLEPGPDVIDTLWGTYYATRDGAAITPLLAMLPWSKDRDSVEKLTLGSIAKFTLASNAARDPELLVLIKRMRAQQPQAVAPVLDDVIAAADTVDVARVRGEALAAVDTLKRKGPGTKRDMAWWGQIGEGALAAGCIAAGVTGHVEVGVPCVVGGAVSSAALRHWTTPD